MNNTSIMILLFAFLGAVYSQEPPPCRPMKDIYPSGKEICENMWGDAFKYEPDEDNAYTMWFFDHKNNPNKKTSQRLSAQGLFSLDSDSLDKCYLNGPVTAHKDDESPVDNSVHPEEEPEDFQECHPWAQESCCSQSTVSSVQKLKSAYGPEWHWDRCGKLSQACERFFVMEACFYECEPSAGIFRRHKADKSHPDPFGGSQPLHEEDSESTNHWEIFQMPIKASFCDAWWLACKDDLFCAESGGNFFTCAKTWEPLLDFTVEAAPGSCKGRCDDPAGKGKCGCDQTCQADSTCCPDREDECFPAWLPVSKQLSGSCYDSCGQKSNNGTCYCDTACEYQKLPDCCEDRNQICPGVVAGSVDGKGSCKNSCGGKTITLKAKCFCDSKCTKKGDCCGDFEDFCAADGTALEEVAIECNSGDC